jgi:DNA-binding NtrC family response regulator
VRELENCIERAVIICDGDEITPEHIGLEGASDAAGLAIRKSEGLQFVAEKAAREAEVRAIREALTACQGNKTRAAEVLCVSYKTLLTKIKDYGIV